MNDIPEYSGNIKSGYIEEVKIPKKQCHNSLKVIIENYLDNKIISIDKEMDKDKELLYTSFLSVHEYYDKYKNNKRII